MDFTAMAPTPQPAPAAFGRNRVFTEPQPPPDNDDAVLPPDDDTPAWMTTIAGIAALIIKEDRTSKFTAIKELRILLTTDQGQQGLPNIVAAGLIPHVMRLLKTETDIEILLQASWCLTNLTAGDPETTRACIDEGALEILAALLENTHEGLRDQALWALGNIAGDSNVCRDMLLQRGILPSVLSHCYAHKLPIRRVSVWTLSNLCRGDNFRDASYIDGILPHIINLVSDADSEIRIDSSWCLRYYFANAQESLGEHWEVVEHLVKLMRLTARPEELQPLGLSLVTALSHSVENIARLIHVGVLDLALQLLMKMPDKIRTHGARILSVITAAPYIAGLQAEREKEEIERDTTKTEEERATALQLHLYTSKERYSRSIHILNELIVASDDKGSYSLLTFILKISSTMRPSDRSTALIHRSLLNLVNYSTPEMLNALCSIESTSTDEFSTTRLASVSSVIVAAKEACVRLPTEGFNKAQASLDPKYLQPSEAAACYDAAIERIASRQS